MNNYFSLVADEFHARSRQLREFVSSHGPSIGTANEVLLRDFLQSCLPKWVSVGHGFILSPTGVASKEIDVLIYRSLLYAPLFSMRDFVIVPPEAVFSVVEVKTRVTKKILHDALTNLISAKQLRPQATTSLFIYNAPMLRTIESYLQSFDFSQVEARHFPDHIYGLSKFCLRSMNVTNKDNRRGVGFLDFTPSTQTGKKDCIFEQFFYDLYSRLEISINQDLKAGINNVWEIKENSVTIHSRLKYATPRDTTVKLVCFAETDGQKET